MNRGMMVALALLAGCSAERGTTQAGGGSWRIAAGGAGGRVGPGTTRVELAAEFPGAVTDTTIQMGEGETAPGTVVHAADPVRRIEVVWQDSGRTRPWRIQVSGDSSRWTVAPGIGLGTSLAQLEELNGGPFQLTGFGWDYAGTVLGWNEGALEQPLLAGNGRVILRLAPGAGAAPSDEAALAGDAVFRSSDPAMQRIDPTVYQIIVEYDQPVER